MEGSTGRGVAVLGGGGTQNGQRRLSGHLLKVKRRSSLWGVQIGRLGDEPFAGWGTRGRKKTGVDRKRTLRQLTDYGMKRTVFLRRRRGVTSEQTLQNKKRSRKKKNGEEEREV